MKVIVPNNTGSIKTKFFMQVFVLQFKVSFISFMQKTKKLATFKKNRNSSPKCSRKIIYSYYCNMERFFINLTYFQDLFDFQNKKNYSNSNQYWTETFNVLFSIITDNTTVLIKCHLVYETLKVAHHIPVL